MKNLIDICLWPPGRPELFIHFLSQSFLSLFIRNYPTIIRRETISNRSRRLDGIVLAFVIPLGAEGERLEGHRDTHEYCTCRDRRRSNAASGGQIARLALAYRL